MRRKLCQELQYTATEILSGEIFRASDSTYNLSFLNDEAARPEVFDNLAQQAELPFQQSVYMPYAQPQKKEEEKKQSQQ